ncbi:phage head-binding domain-containing protein [Pectobacterium parmentieri]|uniref:phage head-binding domain-containing protein n=1 Tax=Pectobacterium parmentieri TaxID=1905730 RepID=UPI000EB3BD90|nr:phage head-binding domain-containing protein [Pectobacterium parmentieri]AYH33222.1 hypothetical protein C5E19_17210 [Pectobacterium parmentieri]
MAITPNVVISMPSQNFTLARAFKANANGKIYIGEIDTDPTIPSNQIQVYLENEDGSHVPVAQPIVINTGGYPVYNGQIAKFVTVQGHSMAIYDAHNVQQFYFPNVLKYDPDQFKLLINSTSGAAEVGTTSGKNVQEEIDNLYQMQNISVDIIIGYGQSNKVGYAQGTTGWPEKITPLAKYYNSLTNTLDPVIPAMHNTSGQNSTGNSWGVFSNKLASLTGRELVILPSAYGGMSIAELSAGSTYYTAMLDGFNAAKSLIAAQGKTLGNVYATFNQGEQDMKIGTTKYDYKVALVGLINAMKSDFDLAGFFIEICGSPRSGYGTEANMYRVQLSQIEICNEQNAVFLGSDCQMHFTVQNMMMQSGDGVHYTQSGYNAVGNELAENIAAVIKKNERVSNNSSLSLYGAVTHSPRRKWFHSYARILVKDGNLSLLDETRTDYRYAAPNVDEISISGKSVLIGLATNTPIIGGEQINTNHYAFVQNGITATGSFSPIPGIGRYAVQVEFYADFEFILQRTGDLYSTSVGGSSTLTSNEFLDKNITASISGADVTLSIPDMYGVPDVSGITGTANIKSMAVNSVVITFGTANYAVVKLSRCKLVPKNLPDGSQFSVGYIIANTGD